MEQSTSIMRIISSTAMALLLALSCGIASAEGASGTEPPPPPPEATDTTPPPPPADPDSTTPSNKAKPQLGKEPGKKLLEGNSQGNGSGS